MEVRIVNLNNKHGIGMVKEENNILLERLRGTEAVRFRVSLPYTSTPHGIYRS